MMKRTPGNSVVGFTTSNEKCGVVQDEPAAGRRNPAPERELRGCVMESRLSPAPRAQCPRPQRVPATDYHAALPLLLWSGCRGRHASRDAYFGVQFRGHATQRGRRRPR